MKWAKWQDIYLKQHYNDEIKVSPAIMAMNLKKSLIAVNKRLRELGLKKLSNPRTGRVDQW